jgi:peptidyl-prolyl cis-trans isomerase SurA
MIIFEELVYQEAVRRKMTIAPARIAREEHNFKGQFASQAEFNQYLKTELGGSEAKLRQMIKRSLLIEAMLKQEVDNKARSRWRRRAVTTKRIRRRSSTARLLRCRRFRLFLRTRRARRWWRIRAKSRGHSGAGQGDQELRAVWAAGGEGLGRRLSRGYGRPEVVKSEKLPPEVVKVAQKMKAGEVSGLIPLGTAWTIIRVNAHTPPGKATFAAVKAELMTICRSRNTNSCEWGWTSGCTRTRRYRKCRSEVRGPSLRSG